jgi:hypothetical protein
MRTLPLPIQTLYAELAQDLSFSAGIHGSVSLRRVGGRDYAYVTEKHGAARVQRYLGSPRDSKVATEIAEINRTALEAKRRRTLVSMLKRSGLPAPSLTLGRLLEAVANAGLFERGIVLIGTAAYQTYSPIIGAILSSAATTTEDADFAAATLAVSAATEGEDLLTILQRADPTFRAKPNLDKWAPPARFRAANGFEVDIITKVRSRKDEKRIPVIAGLSCGAQPLRYLEYLIEEPINAVALYGSGARVSIPQPARFAVHKLIVAQVRDIGAAKRRKDLAQARELFEVLSETLPAELEEALADARRRGRQWSAHIAASLKLIGRQMSPRSERTLTFPGGSSARSRGGWDRCRAGAAGRSSGPDPRSSLSTG